MALGIARWKSFWYVSKYSWNCKHVLWSTSRESIINVCLSPSDINIAEHKSVPLLSLGFNAKFFSFILYPTTALTNKWNTLGKFSTFLLLFVAACELNKRWYVQILVHFGRNLVILFPRSISNQFLEIWVPRSLTYISKNVPDLISSSFTGDSSLLWKGQESIYTFKFKDVQRIDLMTLLISLSDKTGMDILGFDRKLVRIAGEHIVDSLLCIINDSLSNGTFPDDWKIARVTPVYKNNGDINIMSNYRPVSVIGHIAKMVEQRVRSQLV